MAMGSFSMQLNAFKLKSEKQARLVVQKIAMEAFKRVIYRTPVDLGRLLGNWGVQVGSPYMGYNDTASTTDHAAQAAAIASTVGTWNGQGSIYLCNNTQYAIPIEYGHSKIKSPQGMVRVTVAEMGGVAQSIANAAK